MRFIFRHVLFILLMVGLIVFGALVFFVLSASPSMLPALLLALVTLKWGFGYLHFRVYKRE